MKKTYMTLLLAAVALLASAAAPNGSGTYYKAANGKKGAELKTALRGIVQTTVERNYDDLWTDFRTTDKRSDGKVWDMYSSITNFTFGSDQAGSFQKEGDVYNREHSFPKSWFGGAVMPMYTDLHHMYPTDGYVNNRRGNLPFGTTNGGTYKSSGGFSKVGACTYSGYTGEVFEPNDEYKGDLARTYFYMVTRYEEKLADWYNNNSESRTTLNGTAYPAFQTWQLKMLLEWAANDPVSQKEIDRNNAVYGIQLNRNPFIDYPGLEQYIWGSKKDVAFSYDNYVQPDGSGSGSGTGGDEPDPGTDPNPGSAGTYKLTITDADFNGTSYAGNNNEKTSLAVCTTDATKTFEVKWTSYQIMLQSGIMQWQKNAGYIYNSTDLGTIQSVTVTSSEGTFTTYYGTEAQPSSSTTVGGGFFKINVGSATGKSSKVEVIFTIGGSDTPDPEPVIDETPDAYQWVETTINGLATSDVFVIVGVNSQSQSFALPHDGSSNPVATQVKVSGDKITSEVTNNLMWNISGSASAGYTFYPNGETSKWLYCNTEAASGSASNKSIRIGTGGRNLFEMKDDDDGRHLVTKDSYTARYLAVYSGTDWRGYVNATTAPTTIKFYKRVPVQIVEIGKAGYATMVAKANLVIPSGVQAFAVQVKPGYASAFLVPVTDGIPQGEAVVIKASEGTYNFLYTSNQVDAIEENDLVPATMAVTADGSQYCLAYKNNTVGFYRVQEGVTIPEGKAYLEVTTATGGEAPEFYGFSDEDDATSVNEELRIKNEELEGAVYNLAGQQIVNCKSSNRKLPRGIYIKGGRKVLK